MGANSDKVEFEYKKLNDINIRKQKTEERLKQYPDRVPVVLEVGPNTDLDVSLKKNFLIEKTKKCSSFFIEVRKKLKIDKEKALFLITKGYIIKGDQTISEIYDKYKDKEDGILYIHAYGENIFG